jgi:peptide methionine sulfoxide reductase MsrA
MQDLIRKLPGVTAVRVGYSGGDVPNATYRNHGSHAEAIEVVFERDADVVVGAGAQRALATIADGTPP